MSAPSFDKFSLERDTVRVTQLGHVCSTGGLLQAEGLIISVRRMRPGRGLPAHS